MAPRCCSWSWSLSICKRCVHQLPQVMAEPSLGDVNLVKVVNIVNKVNIKGSWQRWLLVMAESSLLEGVHLFAVGGISFAVSKR